MSLILAEFIVATIYASRILEFTTLAQIGTSKSFIIAVNVLAIAGDTLITVTLSWMLHKKCTGHER